jgi:hypothetical protein
VSHRRESHRRTVHEAAVFWVAALLLEVTGDSYLRARTQVGRL